MQHFYTNNQGEVIQYADKKENLRSIKCKPEDIEILSDCENPTKATIDIAQDINEQYR